MKVALSLALVASVLLGCSGGDEGGTSTATPADKLDRPAPADTASGPGSSASQGSGTLPVGK